MTALTDAERRRLAMLADALVPAAEGMPSASAAGVHREGADRVAAVRPDLVQPVRRALAADMALEDLRHDDRAAFDAVGTLVATAYLTDPGVQRLLGYPGHPGLPAGYTDDELPALRELVRPVQERGAPRRPA